MRYIRMFEDVEEKWENIVEQNGKTIIRVWSLAKEMESSVIGKGKYIIADKEDEFFKLIKNLLIGKVITFDSDTVEGIYTGICEDVSFESDIYGGSHEDGFIVSFMFIQLEGKEEYGLEDDLITIHNDIDPDLFRETSKYNL